jgi:hypothetical protein
MGVHRMGWAVLLLVSIAMGCDDEPATGASEPTHQPDAGAPVPAPADAATHARMDAAMHAPDAAPHDAAPDDAQAARDAAPIDSGDGAVDAALDAGNGSMPTTLAETGLYAAGSSGALAPGVMEYSPRYVLWADDADKQRWFWLPEGTQIDTSDMDHWVFPVGTKAWKLFSLAGKKLETRLLWKTEQGWARFAFAWNDDETEASAVANGESDVRGTMHDIPNRTQCNECHSGLPDRLLGISAIQLSHDGAGMTLASLIADGKLSDPPASELALPDTPEWNALGYMHANCGHCHNPRSDKYDRVDLDLWLRVDQLDAVTSTESYKTSVGQMLTEDANTLTFRIAAGDSDMSGVIQRMELRGEDKAMPPIASEQVDTDGVSAVRAFIDGL